MEGRVPVIKFVFFGRQELAALGQLKKNRGLDRRLTVRETKQLCIKYNISRMEAKILYLDHRKEP